MKIIYLSLGTISLSLGLIGIALSVIPTMPFLLVSTYFYTRSSEKLNQKFINSWIYRKYLMDFIEERAMTRKRKWASLILVDILLLVSLISIENLVVRVLIIAIVIIKHWYFYKFVKVK